MDQSYKSNNAPVPYPTMHHSEQNSHNAPVPYPTMHHSEKKCAYFCSEWCIVGYGTGALWDLWIRSYIRDLITCGLAGEISWITCHLFTPVWISEGRVWVIWSQWFVRILGNVSQDLARTGQQMSPLPISMGRTGTHAREDLLYRRFINDIKSWCWCHDSNHYHLTAVSSGESFVNWPAILSCTINP